ncbi:SMI1/KNR4 family protein [Streptacidiphilus albus]|nr:hypothetical protein [Streptacidiphilus albus]
MDMNSSLRRLVDVLSPPGNPQENVDWQAVERRWKVSFPRDFREFMDAYGRGTIDNVLTIATPVDGELTPGVLRCRDLTPIANTESRIDGNEFWYPAWPQMGSLVGWGTTGTGVDLFWCMRGEDPDLWPLVVRNHRGGAAKELFMGMVEFITLTLGDRHHRPFDIPDILGAPHSRFIHAEDERRLMSEGADPWEYLVNSTSSEAGEVNLDRASLGAGS